MVFYKRRLYKITKKGMFCHQIILRVWIMPGFRHQYNSRFHYVTRLLCFRDIVRCVQGQLRKKISWINGDRISRSLPMSSISPLLDQGRVSSATTAKIFVSKNQEASKTLKAIN